MITEKCRGAISNREIESHIRREQPTITPHKRYSGVSLKYYNSECSTLNSFGYCRINLEKYMVVIDYTLNSML